MIRRMMPWLGIACVWVLALGCGNRKITNQGEALWFGSPITVTKAVALSDLAGKPEAFVGQVVLLEGTVRAVCQGSGCWVEVEAADGSTFIAKSLDHSVLVPTDCIGRKVTVQGKVTALPPEPPAEGEQEAQHPAGETPHECPKPSYLVSTMGIELH